MGKSIDTFFWSSLGRKGPQLFGAECGSAAIWVFLALVQRGILTLLKVEQYIPSGLIFSFPLLIQIFGKYIPILRENFPVLPVRIAEGIMGRISPSSMLVIIPAHFLGSLVGIVAFKTLLPFWPTAVYHPVEYEPVALISGIWIEAVAVGLYALIVIVLPEIIEVNKLNPKFLSLATLPVMLLRNNGNWCTFNPSVVYALWYVNRTYSGATLTLSWSTIALPSTMQVLHIVAPFLGGAIAGLICNRVFADSPTSWRRRAHRFR